MGVVRKIFSLFTMLGLLWPSIGFGDIRSLNNNAPLMVESCVEGESEVPYNFLDNYFFQLELLDQHIFLFGQINVPILAQYNFQVVFTPVDIDQNATRGPPNLYT